MNNILRNNRYNIIFNTIIKRHNTDLKPRNNVKIFPLWCEQKILCIQPHISRICRNITSTTFKLPFVISEIKIGNQNTKGDIISNGIYFGLLSLLAQNDIHRWEANEIIHKLCLAQLAIKDGNNDNACSILGEALSLAEEKGFISIIPNIYDLLASIACLEGDIQKAENLLTQLIELLVKSGVPDCDNEVVTFMLKLSRLHSLVGNDEVAEVGFKKCLASQKNKISVDGIPVDDKTYMLWISILFWYGKFLLSIARYEEAKSVLEEALAICTVYDKVLPSQVMIILYNLSEACFVMEEYDASLQYLTTAVQLGKETDSRDLAAYYVRIGIIYTLKGYFDSAREWCENALKLSRNYHNLDIENDATKCLEHLKNIQKKNVLDK